jgi:hypothetical protein
MLLIGQNLAFVGPTQYVTPHKADEICSALNGSGANFLRIWTCCEDWALAIEARKSAWGRSWGWKPPFAPLPEGAESSRRCVQLGGDFATSVNLSTPNPLAVRPATRYTLSGRLRTDSDSTLQISATSVDLGEPVRAERPHTWTRFQREFMTGSDQRWIDHLAFRLASGVGWLDDLSLREAAGGPELLWEAAIRDEIRGYYNPTDCFLLDKLVERAESASIYLQLCLITRDLYMKSLEDSDSEEYAQAIRDARKLLRYAVARWGYSTHVAAWEYFNEINPNLPTDRFYDELGQYLEQIDVYRHLRTTSTWSPSPKDWRHPRLDIAETHHYIRPADKERGHDEVAVVLEKVRLLREHAPQKPVLIGEFGLAEDNWQRSPYMKQDEKLVHFHNSLWASALSGSCGTAAFWWWELLDPMDAYRHYKPLSEFAADVPLDAGLETSAATVSGREVRVVGLQGKACAYVWLFNPQATWWNQVIEKRSPSEIAGARLQVPGLEPGAYEIVWWDTHEGKVVERLNVTLRDAPLDAEVPPFAHDIACKIMRR